MSKSSQLYLKLSSRTDFRIFFQFRGVGGKYDSRIFKVLKVFHGDLSLKNFGSAFNVHSCVGSKIIKF